MSFNVLEDEGGEESEEDDERYTVPTSELRDPVIDQPREYKQDEESKDVDFSKYRRRFETVHHTFDTNLDTDEDHSGAKFDPFLSNDIRFTATSLKTDNTRKESIKKVSNRFISDRFEVDDNKFEKSWRDSDININDITKGDGNFPTEVIPSESAGYSDFHPVDENKSKYEISTSLPSSMIIESFSRQSNSEIFKNFKRAKKPSFAFREHYNDKYKDKGFESFPNSRTHHTSHNSFPHSHFTSFQFSSNKPIVSYGMILFTINENKLEYLICLPKDTPEYSEFIRDKLKDDMTAKKYIGLMRKTERQRILDCYKNGQIHDLVKDFYLDKEFSAKDLKSIERNCTKNIEKYLHLLTNTKTENIEWGFPKGRRNVMETGLDCALRETEEEVKIPKKYIKVIDKITHFDEKFIGSDDKQYQNIFYTGFLPYHLFPSSVSGSKASSEIKYRSTKFRNILSEEVQDIKLVSLVESRPFLNKSKADFILSISKTLRKDKEIIESLI